MKANNAELCEYARFRKLVHDDLSAHLEKKKMKALIPQIVQIIYFGVLFMLCAGSLVFSSSSFVSGGMASFVTALIFMIEPIQVIFCDMKNLYPSQLCLWVFVIYDRFS